MEKTNTSKSPRFQLGLSSQYAGNDEAVARALHEKEENQWREYQRRVAKDREVAVALQHMLDCDLSDNLSGDCSGNSADINSSPRYDEDAELAQALQTALTIEHNEQVAHHLSCDETGVNFDVLEETRVSAKEFAKKWIGTANLVSVEANPHARVGTPLYNIFAERWQRVDEKKIVLAFHGTKECNIDSICKYGFNPELRRGQTHGTGEYFGKTFETSRYYCAGGNKMIIVALLADKSGVTTESSDIIVVHETLHQLPLFVVTFR